MKRRTKKRLGHISAKQKAIAAHCQPVPPSVKDAIKAVVSVMPANVGAALSYRHQCK